MTAKVPSDPAIRGARFRKPDGAGGYAELAPSPKNHLAGEAGDQGSR
jgi:hypothetical protein